MSLRTVLESLVSFVCVVYVCVCVLAIFISDKISDERCRLIFILPQGKTSRKNSVSFLSVGHLNRYQSFCSKHIVPQRVWCTHGDEIGLQSNGMLWNSLNFWNLTVYLFLVNTHPKWMMICYGPFIN